MALVHDINDFEKNAWNACTFIVRSHSGVYYHLCADYNLMCKIYKTIDDRDIRNNIQSLIVKMRRSKNVDNLLIQIRTDVLYPISIRNISYKIVTRDVVLDNIKYVTECGKIVDQFEDYISITWNDFKKIIEHK